MDDPNWLFCIRPALETCVDEQLSLLLHVLSDSLGRRNWTVWAVASRPSAGATRPAGLSDRLRDRLSVTANESCEISYERHYVPRLPRSAGSKGAVHRRRSASPPAVDFVAYGERLNHPREGRCADWQAQRAYVRTSTCSSSSWAAGWSCSQGRRCWRRTSARPGRMPRSTTSSGALRPGLLPVGGLPRRSSRVTAPGSAPLIDPDHW